MLGQPTIQGPTLFVSLTNNKIYSSFDSQMAGVRKALYTPTTKKKPTILVINPIA